MANRYQEIAERIVTYDEAYLVGTGGGNPPVERIAAILREELQPLMEAAIELEKECVWWLDEHHETLHFDARRNKLRAELAKWERP